VVNRPLYKPFSSACLILIWTESWYLAVMILLVAELHVQNNAAQHTSINYNAGQIKDKANLPFPWDVEVHHLTVLVQHGDGGITGM
jgi:hypothetical protein